MKLKFKNQGFQEAATAAVCDVFNGQPFHDPNVYTVDPGRTVDSGQWLVMKPLFRDLRHCSKER